MFSFRTCGFLLLATFFGLSVQAQQLPFAMDAPTTGATSYDASVPTPESVIGHVIGTRHTLPHQVEWYFRAVADQSDRVQFNVHAQSYEGRNLMHAVVTSPANHARLNEILAMQQRVADDPGSVSDEDLADMPVVLYQGYSVHGNESSGTEAAVLYLYHLAAGQGEWIEDALDNAVIIVDPVMNPDGRDRFADWVNRNRGRVATADGQDLEHNEPWPGGRTNHYWFDLNRDWMVAQHPESRGRLDVFHTWRPHILTDHHEMGGGATFFFQPGIPSRNNPNTPKRNNELTHMIAAFHAKGLDEVGSSYYSEESFDDFFLGKGSAFPDVNGSIGILFEQASSRALIGPTSSGDLHYAHTVMNQYVTSLTTLEAGVSLRNELLSYQRSFYADALDRAESSGKDVWLLDLTQGRTRAQMLTQLLQRHRVQFHELAEEVTIDGTTFAPGDAYVIPADQPQYRLIEAFTERTLVYEDSLFYDVSTWTLPLSHDVDFHVVERGGDRLIGDALAAPVELDGGSLTGGTDGVSYLIRWNRYFAPRAVSRLQDAGVTLRMATKPFTALVDGEEVGFDRGTIIVPIMPRLGPGESADPNVVHSVIQTAIAEDHVEVYSADTGLTPSGPDLGGSSTQVLRPVRVAVAAGLGVSTYAAGESWMVLSERMHKPVSVLSPSRLASADLSDYTVIVLPSGSYNDRAAENLLDWTRRGGTLVLMD